MLRSLAGSPGEGGGGDVAPRWLHVPCGWTRRFPPSGGSEALGQTDAYQIGITPPQRQQGPKRRSASLQLAVVSGRRGLFLKNKKCCWLGARGPMSSGIGGT